MEKAMKSKSPESVRFPYQILDVLNDMTKSSHSKELDDIQFGIEVLMLQMRDFAATNKFVKPADRPSDDEIEIELMRAAEFFYDPDKAVMLQKIRDAMMLARPQRRK